jgi:superfamily II DNA or RNA helicase
MNNISVTADRRRLGVFIRYDPALKDSLRALFRAHKGSWLPGAKAWVVPVAEALALTDGLQRMGYGIQPTEVQCQLARARDCPDRRLGQAIAMKLFPLKDDGGTAVQFAYDRATVMAMHTLLARYQPDATSKFWLSRIPPGRLKELLADEAGIHPDDIVVSDEPVDIAIFDRATGAGYGRIDIGETIQGEGDGRATDAGAGDEYLLALAQPLTQHEVDLDAVQLIAHRLSLYAHQAEAVVHLLRFTGALLADDMGVGKTRSAIAAAQLIGLPTIILCPASLKLNWLREITDQCGEPLAHTCVIDGWRSRIRPAPWTILNYENIEVLLRHPRLSNGFTLIIDEAHYIKEPTAQRTQRAFELAARAGRRILLTATPMLNRPGELFTLLKLSGHPAAAIEFARFGSLYGQARDLLGRRVAEWMKRRTKDEVLTLPAKVRSSPVIEVSAELREEYHAIHHDPSMIAIAKLTRLRQALERMKLPFIVETAESIAEDQKVVIFCQYKSSVAALMAQFGNQAVRFTGDESLQARQEAVARFQEPNSGVRYFIGTLEAGGLGITLTAASYVLMASRPLTPSVQYQAEDRACRIGQSRRVEVIIPTVAGTIDRDIQELLDEKETAIEQVLAARLEAQSATHAIAQGDTHVGQQSALGRESGARP